MTRATGPAPRHIAVIDIGKTNAKLALVDLPTLTELAVITRPNTVRAGPPWPHYDIEGHWAFLLAGLAQFHMEYGVDAISVTTHGACAVLLDGDGMLAAPVLDYEHQYQQDILDEYAAVRPDFDVTGSPVLAGGLNIGAQLFWQFATDPTLRDRTAQIVTYPQFWGYRLTGVAATDVTSLGCHTDLWNPHAGTFSDLPRALGIDGKLAAVRGSSEVLGTVLPEIAQRTGLAPDTPVCVGIHDSNASLYPHLLTQEGPFSVVSTGTWVIVMTMQGARVMLAAERDTLVNVNALGQAVPSARFMGGREYEVLQQGQGKPASPQDVADVLASDIMIMPAVASDSGPYKGQHMRWLGAEPGLGTGTRSAAVSFYLALVTDTCLRLTGATGPTIVEGPFAGNRDFTTMLAAATGRPVMTSAAVTGTSIGAALLYGSSASLAAPSVVAVDGALSAHAAYSTRWRAFAG